jgi:hypothetical protein
VIQRHRTPQIRSRRTNRFRRTIWFPPTIPGGPPIPCSTGRGKADLCATLRRVRPTEVWKGSRRQATGTDPVGREPGGAVRPVGAAGKSGGPGTADPAAWLPSRGSRPHRPDTGRPGPGRRNTPARDRDRNIAGRHSRPAAPRPPGPTRPGSNGSGTWKHLGVMDSNGKYVSSAPSLTTGPVGPSLRPNRGRRFRPKAEPVGLSLLPRLRNGTSAKSVNQRRPSDNPGFTPITRRSRAGCTDCVCGSCRSSRSGRPGQ